MMLGEISQMEIWMLVSQLIIAVCTIGALIFVAASFNKKAAVKFQQPVSITITEELHKVFASKNEFETHLRDFKDKHNIIWQTLRSENQRIGSEVTATREAIAGLESTTEIQNQQLNAIQADIKQLIRRV